MGFFITFEGIEGCGKSTQVRLLSELLRSRGVEITVTREPGGTVIGGKIREILLNREHTGMAPEAELLLYAADRAQHVREVIRTALDRDEVVICDRFTDATLAYQGYGRGLDISLIRKLNSIASLGITPDMTIILDCPVEMGLARAANRNAQRDGVVDDRFEREALEFHKKVRDGYLEIAGREASRVRVVDATQDIESLHGDIVQIIDGYLKDIN